MKRPTITTLPQAPADERHRRFMVYTIMMGVRVVCLFVMIFVPDWWKLVPALGAIFLPYIAVMLANVGAEPDHRQVPSPGGLVRAPRPEPHEEKGPQP